MIHKVGMHWLREHPDNKVDLPHIEAMQYPSIKLFKNVWDNRDACAGILSVLPRDSYILGRDHALSEQKQDMWDDPVGTGTRHANEWAEKVQRGQCFLPTDRTFFLGINEPDATNGDRNAIDKYTEAFLDRLRVHGLRGGAFNFSTGHPRTIDGTPNTQADYTVFERSHQAIVRGHHIGVLHIYGTAAVPCAPGNYDRLKACDWQDVEWVVGEMAADEHVIGGGNHDGFITSFAGHLNDYPAWIDTLIMGVNDPRIHSYQIFTYDFSHPWSSFDVSEIRDALESYQWRHVNTQPTPAPQPQPAPAFVLVFDGVNMRNTPEVTEGNIVAKLPFGEQVAVLDRTQGADKLMWAHVLHGKTRGFIRDDLLGAEKLLQKPAPAPEQPQPFDPAQGKPVASGVLDPLVLEAIVLTESGGEGFEDGRLKIRTEAHLLQGSTWGNPTLFSRYFRYEAANILNAYYQRAESDPWIMYHGNQDLEWDAFEFACTLDKAAALRCTSFGAGQIMGFNAKRVGYSTPQSMFDAFKRSELAQTMAVINYCLSDDDLVAAIRNRDWGGIIRGYNGQGLEAVYGPRLVKNYVKVGGVA